MWRHPRRPWVGDEEKIRRGRRPAPDAWDNWPYVESHPPHTYAGMFFDIDEPDRWEFEVDGPCPNWQIRKDGPRPTYHVAYTLEIPVARHDTAQGRIALYYRDVYDGLSFLLGADPRFDGVMAKNPLHPPSGCAVDWIRREPYSLLELREWLPAVIPKPVHTTSVGRNEDLFRHCVKLAHQPGWTRTIAAEGHAGRWLAYVRRLNIAGSKMTDAAMVRWAQQHFGPYAGYAGQYLFHEQRQQTSGGPAGGAPKRPSGVHLGEAAAVTSRSGYRNRDWPCPKCGVGIGQVCRYPSNYHYVKGHSQRGPRG